MAPTQSSTSNSGAQAMGSRLFADSLISSALASRGGRKVMRIGQRWAPAIELLTLFLICVLCFFVRLFAVIRYESVIHEFDPYFNFRTTRYLAREGFMEFWNWFDDGSWYPLGRVIGQTLYPGLMTTAAVVHSFFNFFGFIINIRDVCVFLAPIFSGFTAIAAYLLTKEVTGRGECGLFAAIFLGLSPAYLSRSVGGSYDNEAVAIFALVFAFYVFVKALNAGTLLSSMLAALAYFYMVASWGGYVFITNAVSIYVVVLTALGRLEPHHYVAYCVFYIIGTVLCLNIPFVNFQAVQSSEHMASHGVFVLLNACWLGQYLRALLPRDSYKSILRIIVVASVGSFLAVFIWLTMTGRTTWAGRSMTLLDPTFAAKYIPIIASVSEHQPTTWASYVFDINFCALLSPVGLYVSFTRQQDGYLFVALYAVLAVYFSGVMVRLMLVLAPAASVMAAIGLTFVLSSFFSHIRSPSRIEKMLQIDLQEAKAVAQGKPSSSKLNAAAAVAAKSSDSANSVATVSPSLSIFLIGILFYGCCCYVSHGVFSSALVYSHPSVVHSQHLRDGTRLIQDDFREAYYWFRKNTHQDARLMSWWDYGYQSCTMGNRTVLVDNNTWNNTHIATVGLAFASPEEEAYPILLKLDVDYVFVIFGGLARYSGDDINKFLWMVRIAAGVYPWIKERDYFSSTGQFTIGRNVSPAMKNSLLYSLCYHRFAEATNGGFDGVRNEEIGRKDVTLQHLEEAYTTENWMVRVYKVKRPPNRQKAIPRFPST